MDRPTGGGTRTGARLEPLGELLHKPAHNVRRSPGANGGSAHLDPLSEERSPTDPELGLDLCVVVQAAPDTDELPAFRGMCCGSPGVSGSVSGMSEPAPRPISMPPTRCRCCDTPRSIARG